MLAYAPVCRPRLSGLRCYFELPHTELVRNQYRVEVRHDPAPQIVVWCDVAPGARVLVGCVDERNVLWATRRWTTDVDAWLRRLCVDSPVRGLCRWCPVCPVCGVDASSEAAWSLDCCLAFVAWSARAERSAKRLPLQCGAVRRGLVRGRGGSPLFS